MINNRPRFNPQRLVILMPDAIRRYELQFNGHVSPFMKQCR